jgi:hypothetical protein
MQYSTRTLLYVFLVLSLGLAGLRYANDILGAVFTTAAFTMLLVSLALAILQTGASQRYWIGFTVLGGGYFLFVAFAERGFDPLATALLGVRRGGSGNILAPPILVTTHLLMFADSCMQHVRETGSPAPYSVSAAVRSTTSQGPLGNEASIAFFAVGQSLFTLVFCLVGGWLGSRFGQKGSATMAQGALPPSDEIP